MSTVLFGQEKAHIKANIGWISQNIHPPKKENAIESSAQRWGYKRDVSLKHYSVCVFLELYGNGVDVE